MKFYEAIEWLRSDLDDEQEELNQFFNDYQLANFIVRGLQETNDVLKLAHKYQFIVLQPYIDVYDLNSDYVRFRKLYDVKHQTIMDWNKYTAMLSTNNRNEFTGLNDFQRRIKIDDSRGKLYLSVLPDDDDNYEYDVTANNLTNSPPTITIDDVTNSFSKWFEPTWVVIDGKALKVSDYEEVSTTSRKLYISEQITDTTISVTTDKAKLVNLVIDYIYQPNKNDFCYKTSSKGTLTANSTTVTLASGLVTDSGNNIEVGDYITIKEYGTREVTTVGTNTFTVDEAFSELYPTTSTSYTMYLTKAQSNLPIQIEVQNVVLQYAKYYALMRANDPNANNQLALVRNLLQDEQYRQLQEQIQKVNTNTREDRFGEFYG